MLTFYKKLSGKSQFSLYLLREIFNKRGKVYYSAFGEDSIVEGILSRYKFLTGQKFTFSYIDLGSWMPVTDSNTYFYYKKGVRGTAIDANKNLIKFWKLRKKDFFLNVACSNDKTSSMNFFNKFAPSNTLNNEFAERLSKAQNRIIEFKETLNSVSLKEIVDKHLSKYPGNFMLDIDLEGMDLEILKSYDFRSMPRPSILLIEDVPGVPSKFSNSDITMYLQHNQYSLVGRSVITSVFIDNQCPLIKVLSF